MIHAEHRTGRTFWIRFDLASKFLTSKCLREIETAANIIAEQRLLGLRLRLLGLFFAFGGWLRLVIDRPLGAIGQDRVGVQHLLEFARCFVIAGITVRMKTKNHSSISAFDLLR